MIAARRTCALLLVVALHLQGCKHGKSATDYSTASVEADRGIFMGGVISATPSSGEILVIVELSPAVHPDSRRLCELCRAGHPVAVHLRQDAADAAPVVVSDITSHGEAIIRCKSREDAQRVVDQLHAWPSG